MNNKHPETKSATMSKTDNIEVLRGLYAEAQEKLRAMLPILASELGVPVGDVSIQTSTYPTFSTGAFLSHSTVSLLHGSDVESCLNRLRFSLAEQEAPDANA